ncbi:hypothetical protein C7M71_001705 [Peterkaempfera bronchialis]|uniref:Uncharacterized protein n=2 Tax=Peterkaempfera bronchialis TaxID=2126346 RepID=A0A345SRM9_9ACTN|nr:hypothetical protein C7M71_001705 [Peterkaempfera bronchialis]
MIMHNVPITAATDVLALQRDVDAANDAVRAFAAQRTDWSREAVLELQRLHTGYLAALAALRSAPRSGLCTAA